MRPIHVLRAVFVLAASSLTLTACGLKPDTLLGIPGVVGEEDNSLVISDIPVDTLPQQLDLTDPADPAHCRYADNANGIVFTYPAEFSMELEYTDGYARFCDPSGAGTVLYYVDDVSTDAEEDGLFQYDSYSEYITTAQVNGRLCYAILTWQEGSGTDFSSLTDFSFAEQ